MVSLGMRYLVSFFLVLGPCHSLLSQEAALPAAADYASVSLSGYVSSAYHFGSGSGTGRYPFALSPSHRNAFSMDVVGLSLRRPLDEWLFDSGFQFDLWVGPDASLLDSDNSANSVNIRRAFIDFRIPLFDPRVTGVARSLDLRVGTFDSPLGYESLDRDSSNPHYTRSWGFTIEPTLHTGLLAMYPGVDALENGESDFLFSLGIANSIDPRIDGVPVNSDRKSFLSGATWLLPDVMGRLSGTAFSVGYTNGRTRSGDAPVQNLYFGVGLPLESEQWDLALTHDSRMEYGDGNDDSVWGAYLSYRPNTKSTLSLRGELFQEGEKLFSSESAAEQSDGYGLTFTYDYRLSKHILSRAEWRWDHTEERVNDRCNSQSWHLNLVYEF